MRLAPALTLWVLACAGAGWLHAHSAPSDYYAAVKFVLQPRHIANDGPEDLRRYHQYALDSEEAETELYVLRSERALRTVFDNLRLANDPDLQCGKSRPWWRVVAGQSQADEACRQHPDDMAFAAFNERVRTRRVGLSYVLEVAYRSSDPDRSVSVANAIASIYLQGRVARTIALVQTNLPYLRRRATMMLGESLSAAEAAASGTVPAAYLPDADVRLLGPALRPFGRAFPSTTPIVVIATAMGVLSGLLVIMLGEALDPRIRSWRDLTQGTRLPCFNAGLFGRRRLRILSRQQGVSDLEALKATRAAIRNDSGETTPRVIGFVSWASPERTQAVASGFAALENSSKAGVRFVDLSRSGTPSGDQPSCPVALRTALAENPEGLVVALPPLKEPWETAFALPLFDVIVLVIEQNKTSWADIRAARGLLGPAGKFRSGLHFCGT